MELIIDATVLFTGLIGTGITKGIIFSDAVELKAPEHLDDEFEEHKQRVEDLSKLSSEELDGLFGKIMARIEFVPKEKFEKFMEQANSLISDKDDTEYLALSLALDKTPIWSNDPHFKQQSSVKVFDTKQLVKHLSSLGYEF